LMFVVGLHVRALMPGLSLGLIYTAYNTVALYGDDMRQTL